MQRAEEVVERALAAVAASKARRERHEREREAAYSRIQVAMLKKPIIPKGMQMTLDLHRRVPSSAAETDLRAATFRSNNADPSIAWE